MRFIGIDPSTKTGFVALDESGQVLRSKELTGIGNKDPVRMITLIDEVIRHIEKDDIIVIESFAFMAKGQYVVQLGGIGWGIRMALVRRGFKYIEVAPGQLKKFGCGKGNASKDDLAVGIYKNFGFEHTSDDVRDAYVLAQIGRALKHRKVDYQYQKEVIETILNPPKKKVKK
ncbi:crossover junction endodeoxyribonuclease RuvC [Pseudogracilibacillus auburnensis]|uniref:crossover junction endodeoxyribonuclease RuvC n=1 Tax=Pseudogracilibacillus auburnensis TaxID=1494959 RepID=UPI001A96385B|nr:crossover junction endodeoxyribonuclease RuvC [Pseudogracilibacillus auburnensis]MBO1003139.1 crossover junction endodeoxyribonuclease RuvC [Pseudogracilibacillus auburnensis]